MGLLDCTMRVVSDVPRVTAVIPLA